MTSYFEGEGCREKAESFAAENKGTITDVSYTTHAMPDSFWDGIRTSPSPVAQAIREWASRYYGGNLESAWSDATEGSVPGVRSDFCAAMDEKLRTPKRVARYMVEYGESEPKPEFRSYSIDAGDVGNEDGAWGSSTSDGWRVD